jgi:type I restriction enzyme S subunit
MYYLQAGFTQLGIYEGAGNKTTIPNLSRGRLAALPVPTPPKPEQEKIAAVLWKVQRAIELEEQLAATTRELKQSAMRQLFTHGLRDERQKDTEIGPLPETWSTAPLGSFGRIGNGSTPLKANTSYWANGSIPWLTSAKVYDVTIREADQFVTQTAVDECHLPKVKPGSVLLAITGQGKTLGHAAVTAIETCVSQHIAFLSFNDTPVNPHFIRLFLESRYLELRDVAQGGGSTKGALTCGFLKTFRVPKPEPEEQDQIASTLMTIEAKISVHERKRNALQDLFRTMLHELMSAQIRVDKLAIDTSEVVALSPQPA